MPTDRRAFERWLRDWDAVDEQTIRDYRAAEGGYEIPEWDAAWTAWREAARRATANGSVRQGDGNG